MSKITLDIPENEYNILKERAKADERSLTTYLTRLIKFYAQFPAPGTTPPPTPFPNTTNVFTSGTPIPTSDYRVFSAGAPDVQSTEQAAGYLLANGYKITPPRSNADTDPCIAALKAEKIKAQIENINASTDRKKELSYKNNLKSALQKFRDMYITAARSLHGSQADIDDELASCDQLQEAYVDEYLVDEDGVLIEEDYETYAQAHPTHPHIVSMLCLYRNVQDVAESIAERIMPASYRHELEEKEYFTTHPDSGACPYYPYNNLTWGDFRHWTTQYEQDSDRENDLMYDMFGLPGDKGSAKEREYYLYSDKRYLMSLSPDDDTYLKRLDEAQELKKIDLEHTNVDLIKLKEYYEARGDRDVFLSLLTHDDEVSGYDSLIYHELPLIRRAFQYASSNVFDDNNHYDEDKGYITYTWLLTLFNTPDKTRPKLHTEPVFFTNAPAPEQTDTQTQSPTTTKKITIIE